MTHQRVTRSLNDASNGMILFYNTENFFDTEDNPKTDDDFLPYSFKKMDT